MIGFVVLGAALGRLQTAARDKGRVDPVSTAIHFLTEPLAGPISRGLTHGGEFFAGVFNARSLEAQNAALKAKLVGYEAYSSRVDFLNGQIEDLRKLLAAPPSNRKRVSVDVIGFSEADQSLLLNGGSELGIKADQPVISGEGLVGIVQTVSKGESRVALLTAYGVKIFGVDARTPPEEGLISGSGDWTLKMLMLIPKDPVSMGDQILTSMKSKNIPGGLVVGQVISIDDDPYYGTRRLTLVQAVSAGSVHTVQVLE